jgi:hypothetical protein
MCYEIHPRSQFQRCKEVADPALADDFFWVDQRIFSDKAWTISWNWSAQVFEEKVGAGWREGCGILALILGSLF